MVASEILADNLHSGVVNFFFAMRQNDGKLKALFQKVHPDQDGLQEKVGPKG